MDFSFTEEQTLLEESVSRFIQNDYSFEDRQKTIKSDLGFSADHWSMFAELGWLGVPFNEADGGFGGGAVESMLMAESFGRGLVVEPYLATVVLAGGALKLAGSDDQKAKYLPGIVDGSVQGALAYVEPQARFNLADLKTEATADGDGYVLNGYKAVVLNGPSANVRHSIAGLPGNRNASSASSSPRVTASFELGSMTTIGPCEPLLSFAMTVLPCYRRADTTKLDARFRATQSAPPPRHTSLSPRPSPNPQSRARVFPARTLHTRRSIRPSKNHGHGRRAPSRQRRRW